MATLMDQIMGRAVPAAPMASGADSTMMGFMPPTLATPYGGLGMPVAPYTPSPETDALQRQLNRVPFGPPMPANLPMPAPQASYADMYAGYRLPPAPAAAAAPQAAPPPLPPVRPYGLGTPEPSVRQSFMDAILRGPAYQSNAMPVITTTAGPMQSGPPIPQSVNWGNPESAADFFRADQAARQLGLLG